MAGLNDHLEFRGRVADIDHAARSQIGGNRSVVGARAESALLHLDPLRFGFQILGLASSLLPRAPAIARPKLPNWLCRLSACAQT